MHAQELCHTKEILPLSTETFDVASELVVFLILRLL